MQSLIFSFYFTLTLFVFLNVSNSQSNNTKTIIVDQSGKGSFIKVQQAIDSIPLNNQEWTIIHLNAGVYIEKVQIPQDKQYIILEGESNSLSVIQYGDFGSSLESSTFQLYADNFMARDITFKNTFDHATFILSDDLITWAPAAFIQGDKVSFHHCSFVGLQDTLTDWKGRHYFEHCYFEGAIDFIWGDGQSVYQNCKINVTASRLSSGNAYITAQSRESENDTSGFVFKYCKVIGTGPAFLGRAYGNYSRVVFFNTLLDNIIAPSGWDAWQNVGKEETITYSEIGCRGPGADMSKRVTWEKKLTGEEVNKLIDIDLFINQEKWIEEQLKHQ